MSNIQNIRTQGTSGVNPNSSDTGNNLSDPGASDKNKTNLSELESLRSKMTTQSGAGSNAKAQASEYAQQAQQYKSKAEDGSSVSGIKELLMMARQMIQRTKEEITIMKESFTGAKSAKLELQQKAQSVPGVPTEGSSTETQNDFLFNQKSNNPIST